MKTAPAAVKTFLDGLPSGSRVAFRADLYTLTLLNGTIYRWTTCDASIKVGANTWLADGTVLRRSNVRITSLLEIDNLQVELSAVATLSGKSVGRQAAEGLFFGARLQLDHVVGNDATHALSLGPILAWYEGRVAATRLAGNSVQVTVESDIAALQRTILPQFVYQPACSHAVYDPNCTLVKATFTDAGTASGTLSTTQVQATTAAIIAKAAGYYALGVLTFTSGALSGMRRAVKSFSVSGGVGTFTLALPLPSAPAVNDTFTSYAGCDRKQATCVSKFNNLVNFRGFPHVPVTEGAA